jgi:maltooligosyltrehalose trehalohydrolase
MLGDRLAALVSPARLKLAAAVLLLAPYLPLLFMGEEWGETNPFLYFISHTDPELVRAVQQGRAAEFAAFMAQGEGQPPDPASPETFSRSKLNWDRAQEGWHADLRGLYKALIALRKAVPALRHLSQEHQEVFTFEDERTLAVHRWFGQSHALALYHFGEQPATVRVPAPCGTWCRAAGSDAAAAEELDVANGRAEVRLNPESFVLYVQGGLA